MPEDTLPTHPSDDTLVLTVTIFRVVFWSEVRRPRK
jgi:hypothetical protein